MVEFWNTHGYAWVVLPLLIFLARILDVSIATMRFMFLARGSRIPTVITGFFEALIWIIIISQIIRNLDNFLCFIAYAGGFATGSYVGMKIEERLAIGKVVMRIITHQSADNLIAELRNRRFGVTSVNAEGARGPVRILFMVLKRSDLETAVGVIKKFNPNAFYTVEDIRYVSEGVYRRQNEPSVRMHGFKRAVHDYECRRDSGRNARAKNRGGRTALQFRRTAHRTNH